MFFSACIGQPKRRYFAWSPIRGLFFGTLYRKLGFYIFKAYLLHLILNLLYLATPLSIEHLVLESKLELHFQVHVYSAKCSKRIATAILQEVVERPKPMMLNIHLDNVAKISAITSSFKYRCSFTMKLNSMHISFSLFEVSLRCLTIINSFLQSKQITIVLKHKNLKIKRFLSPINEIIDHWCFGTVAIYCDISSTAFVSSAFET